MQKKAKPKQKGKQDIRQVKRPEKQNSKGMIKNNNLTKKVIKNVFFQGISGIISKIGGFIFIIIVARMLFPELFGLYSLALAVIMSNFEKPKTL